MGWYRDYLREVKARERAIIESLPDEDAVNRWLLENRGLSLREWVDSL